MADRLSRPNKYPRWAEDDQTAPIEQGGQNNVVEPPESYKLSGNKPNEEPPRQFDNWFKRKSNNWFKYLNQEAFGGTDFNFYQLMSNPAYITPNGLSISGTNFTFKGNSLWDSSVTGGKSYPRLGAICKPFNVLNLHPMTPNLLPVFFNESNDFVKDYLTPWSAGDNGGLNVTDNTPNKWVFLFVLGNENSYAPVGGVPGKVDFAADVDPLGQNIINNQDIIDEGYTHFGLLGAFIFYELQNVKKFDSLVSGHDNYFYYREDFVFSYGVSGASNISYQDLSLFVGTDSGNVSKIPSWGTEINCLLSNGDTDTFHISGGDSSQFTILNKSANVQLKLDCIGSKIRYKTVQGIASDFFLHLYGYKNPASVYTPISYPAST